jgi:hypothetical protein
MKKGGRRVNVRNPSIVCLRRVAVGARECPSAGVREREDDTLKLGRGGTRGMQLGASPGRVPKRGRARFQDRFPLPHETAGGFMYPGDL